MFGALLMTSATFSPSERPFLSEYNIGVHENRKFATFKELMERSENQDVRNEIEKVAQDLEGVTLDEMHEMGLYKLARNRRAHKGKSLAQDTARRRLDVASVEMSPSCR